MSLFSVLMLGPVRGTVFGGSGMTAGLFFLPGMAAAGVLLTGFQTMALTVATERDDGTLKRLRSFL